jgi:hypothetical protein
MKKNYLLVPLFILIKKYCFFLKLKDIFSFEENEFWIKSSKVIITKGAGTVFFWGRTGACGVHIKPRRLRLATFSKPISLIFYRDRYGFVGLGKYHKKFALRLCPIVNTPIRAHPF